MSTDVVNITSMNGTVENPTFPNLYAWIDAVEGADRLTVAAGYEVLNTFESDAWHAAVDAEWDQYVKDHAYDPPWNKRGWNKFCEWLQARAEVDGHPYAKSERYFRQLRNAAEMHRYVSREVRAIARTSLPPCETAWRPFTRLLTGGTTEKRDGPRWGPELVQAVELAIGIAEDEQKSEFTMGVASKARGEIWRTAPRIRDWVDQPNKPKGDETERDASVRMMQTEQRHLEKFLRAGRPQENKRLRDWYVGEVDAL